MSDNLGTTEKELVRVRTEKLEKIEKMGINPYPNSAKKDYSSQRILAISSELIASGQRIYYSGRIIASRGHGKLSFFDVADEQGKIQVILKEDLLAKDAGLIPLLDIGDFIEVAGKIFMTNSGEITIEVIELKVVAKALRPLPDKRHGITDEEVRYRKRYLDLLTNPELRDLFHKKAKFWQSIRNFLIEKGFLEVETPVLETTTGGADATPFVTHHDALDIDVYLRISMGELWQKKLLVGGFEKTFEIGRQFRNEGISREHLQDYSQMEFYWAYANYDDSMLLVEDLYKKIAKETFGTYKFTIGNHEVDLDKDWERIDYTETIKSKLGIDILSVSDDELTAKIKEFGLEHKKSDTKGRMIDSLWKSIRGSISGPAFVINHPVEVSPLAKRKSDNPKLTERYQVIIAGSELGNGYSELNDPRDQKQRFIEQARMREGGDSEAQMNDESFIEALEYGMPPATGFGLSERLFAFFVDKPIRECVLFPLVRPEK